MMFNRHVAQADSLALWTETTMLSETTEKEVVRQVKTVREEETVKTMGGDMVGQALAVIPTNSTIVHHVHEGIELPALQSLSPHHHHPVFMMKT